MPHIVFHSRDFDGVASAAIAVKKLGFENCNLYPWDYGEDEPEIPYDRDTIYVIDISPEKLLTEDRDQEVIWIDHHASAIRKLDPDIKGLRIDGVAASRLAWLWFNHDNPETLRGLEIEEIHTALEAWGEPPAIEMVGLYDVWKISPRILDFQYGLVARKMLSWSEEVLARWSSLMDDTMFFKDIEESGRWARAYYDEQAKITCRLKAYDLEFEGLKFLAMNSTDPSSRAFNTSNVDDYDGLLKWNIVPTGQINVSLYRPVADDKIDLSIIAQKYGGGGHKGACGFSVPVSEIGMFLPDGT